MNIFFENEIVKKTGLLKVVLTNFKRWNLRQDSIWRLNTNVTRIIYKYKVNLQELKVV